MRLTRRRLHPLPLQLPRLDGTTWPDRRVVGRTSFAARTLYQMGYREAFAPEAHDITDLLLARALPLLPTAAAPEDEPYLRRVFSSAAQIGAGIGIIERRVVQPEELCTDRQIAGALWVAADDLPSMPAHQLDIARFLLHCGYYLARTDPAKVRLLVEALGDEDDPGDEPRP
jgi:hypothetical protein